MTQITKEAIEALESARAHILDAYRIWQADDVSAVPPPKSGAGAVIAKIDAVLSTLPIAVEGKAMHEHFKQMQEMCRDYLRPETYVSRFPGQPNAHASEFNMPGPHQSEQQSAIMHSRRDRAFISDIIRMLDGPEQREAEALISPPGKDGGQEVEAVKTVWQVADAIDPERSPDGGWRDQLLNEIHADLENRGRRDKDFAVTVHHRNIVISAVSKALRGLSSVSKEAAPMKDHARGCEGRNYTCTCGHDAANTALIERLTKALEPFAREANAWPDDHAPDEYRVKIALETKVMPAKFTVGDLREARAALSSSSTSRGGER